jgi:hypothetical protein
MKNSTRIMSTTALAFVLAALALPLSTTLTLAQVAVRPCATATCKGAPAPLLGAGLPGLAIGLGYGAYWLARRRRNAG